MNKEDVLTEFSSLMNSVKSNRKMQIPAFFPVWKISLAYPFLFLVNHICYYLYLYYDSGKDFEYIWGSMQLVCLAATAISGFIIANSIYLFASFFLSIPNELRENSVLCKFVVKITKRFLISLGVVLPLMSYIVFHSGLWKFNLIFGIALQVILPSIIVVFARTECIRYGIPFAANKIIELVRQ